eukprot:6462979-Amphidinium_carterae.1
MQCAGIGAAWCRRGEEPGWPTSSLRACLDAQPAVPSEHLLHTHFKTLATLSCTVAEEGGAPQSQDSRQRQKKCQELQCCTSTPRGAERNCYMSTDPSPVCCSWIWIQWQLPQVESIKRNTAS